MKFDLEVDAVNTKILITREKSQRRLRGVE